MKYLADLLEWVFKHPILTLVIIYAFACVIDLVAPIETNRGSWWNAFAWVLRLVCLA